MGGLWTKQLHPAIALGWDCTWRGRARQFAGWASVCDEQLVVSP